MAIVYKNKNEIQKFVDEAAQETKNALKIDGRVDKTYNLEIIKEDRTRFTPAPIIVQHSTTLESTESGAISIDNTLTRKAATKDAIKKALLDD